MKPKNWISALLVPVILTNLSAYGQELTVTALGGYTFQHKVDFSNAVCYIRNSAHYGLSLEGINKEGIGLELLYQRQETHIPVYSKTNPDELLTSKDNVTISYFMLNGIIYIRANPSLSPYLGFGVGISLLNVDGATTSGSQTYTDAQTKFTWDAKLGIKFNLSPTTSIKLQSQIYAIANVNGRGIYYEEASSVWAYQFGFTAGVCYRFFKAKPKL